MGNVIDLKTKKLITTANWDSFVATVGDTVIFHRSNAYTGKGYLALNLESEHYDFIPENTWYQPRYSSSAPNNTYYLTIDKSRLPYKVCLNDYQR